MPVILRATIGQMFLARVESSSTRTAFRYKPSFNFETGDPVPPAQSKWTDLSFRRFYDRARLASFGLLSLGVQPGEKVTLFSGTRVGAAFSEMAILGVRATIHAIHPLTATMTAAADLAGARIAIAGNSEQLLKLLEIEHPKLEKIVVIDPGAMRVAPLRQWKSAFDPKNILTLQALIELGRREEGRGPARFNDHLQAASPNEIAYWTADATPLTHAELIDATADLINQLGTGVRADRECALSLLPPSDLFGKLEALVSTSLGSVRAFGRDPSKPERDFLDIQPTLLFTRPKLLENAYLKAEQQGASPLLDWLRPRRRTREFGSRLRYAICEGEPLYPESIPFFERSGTQLIITSEPREAQEILVLETGEKISPRKLERAVLRNRPIHQCVVWGDRKPFVTALIVLDQKQVLAFATENHILFSEYSELIKNQKVMFWVEKMIERVNEPLAPYERIRKFLILPEELRIDRDELTPDSEIRREIVQSRYRTEFDKLYEA
ncbi:MAG: AMP-binding protein [Oligoflexia bacterium]|nr:AMP-binding protein [Oligoflexia bacterium]